MRPRSRRTVGLVMKHEFRVTVARRSFWLTTFLLPLAILVLTLGVQVFAGNSTTGTTLPTNGQTQTGPTLGFVDLSGILVRLPTGVDDALLRRFPDRASADAALRQGELSGYYVIANDYLKTGGLTYVAKNFRPLGGADVNPLLTYALDYNLTGSENSSRLLIDPFVTLTSTSAAPANESRGTSDALSFAVPYAALFILYLVLVMTGGFMLNSVAKEKENRTAELLLVSLRARDLLLGKVLGLAGVGLLQIGVWLGVGLIALSQVRRVFDTLGTYNLPAGFVPWTLAYFLLGFFLYSALYAALGVMSRTVREASQLMYVALIPLIAPLLLASSLIEQPNGGLSVALSLFPLTSPIAMVTRLAGGTVALWQILTGLVLLAAGAYGVVLLAARFFRVENLLSTRAFSWRGLAQQFRTSRSA